MQPTCGSFPSPACCPIRCDYRTKVNGIKVKERKGYNIDKCKSCNGTGRVPDFQYSYTMHSRYADNEGPEEGPWMNCPACKGFGQRILRIGKLR